MALASALSALCLCGTARAQSLDYLRNLLDATPAGGWVKANTNTWSDAWPTGTLAVDATQAAAATRSVLDAWSSFAWDSTRNNLLLWGGGHASYGGNEMYVWNGSTGKWSLGSLPSRMVSVPGAEDARLRVAADLLAPQSAHTYEGNLYLPVNDKFMTLGGPTYNAAQVFQTVNSSGQVVNTGAWYWDPAKADGTKVGGSSGSGWDPSTAGGNMWTNQDGSWQTESLRHFLSNSTAYRTEAGQDVVYVVAKPGSWGWLYKFAPGDVSGGSQGSWELVGSPSYLAPNSEGSGTIDLQHNLYINTAYSAGNPYDLNVWNLATPGARNVDVAVQLMFADGTPFAINRAYGIDYNAADGRFYMWDSFERGVVYRTAAEFLPDGSLDTAWTIERLASTSGAEPVGLHAHTVNGKWQYVAALGAYVAMDSFNTATGDAAVWFYKPEVTAVPEPASTALLLAGLGFMGLKLRRRAAAMSPA